MRALKGVTARHPAYFSPTVSTMRTVDNHVTGHRDRVRVGVNKGHANKWGLSPFLMKTPEWGAPEIL